MDAFLSALASFALIGFAVIGAWHFARWTGMIGQRDDDDTVLDHIRVEQTGITETHRQKLIEAAKRHGRPFKTREQVYREVAKSHDLLEIEKASKAIALIERDVNPVVTNIKGARRQ